MEKRVLIIDDDEKLADLLREFLARYGFAASAAHRPADALALLRRESFAAIILDVMLPEMSGFELCREIRAFSATPIIMLTARGDIVDKVVGLEIGADDYLPKPFEPRELAARLQALLRRAAHQFAAGETLRFEGLKIDLGSQWAFVRGDSYSPPNNNDDGDEKAVELTAAEFRLLSALVRERPKVVSRDDLIEEMRGFERDVFDRSIDIQVSRLRAKLGDSPRMPRFIRTARGAGYAFIAKPSAA
jgi:DNA-binding response OmpR family regulator